LIVAFAKGFTIEAAIGMITGARISTPIPSKMGVPILSPLSKSAISSPHFKKCKVYFNPRQQGGRTAIYSHNFRNTEAKSSDWVCQR
jgi:hypothetical protein